MKDTSIGDLSFGLSKQALAVLQVLANSEPTFASYNEKARAYDCWISTFPLYNGRECGFCLQMRRLPLQSAEPALHIFIAECRNSDSLFVWHWEALIGGSGAPTVASAPEDSYAQRRVLGFGRIDLAVEAVHKIAKDFYAR